MPAWHDAWAAGPVRGASAVVLGRDVSARPAVRDVWAVALGHDVSAAGPVRDAPEGGLDRDVSAAGPVRDAPARSARAASAARRSQLFQRRNCFLQLLLLSTK